MARTCAQGLTMDGGGAGTPTRTDDPFVVDVRACMKELTQQQRTILLADLAAGGMAPAWRLAEEMHTSRNTIYVARNAGRKAIRAALLRRGHVLGYGTAWASPTR